MFKSSSPLLSAFLKSTFYRTRSPEKISVHLNTFLGHLMGLTLFKGGLFNEIINAAVGVRYRGLKNRRNRLNASVKEIQQFKNFL